jgi:hypothetical protein
MYSKRKTYSEAYAFVKLKRSVAKPNFSLVKQLLIFEQNLHLDKDLGKSRKSQITKQFIDKQINLDSSPSLQMFKGLGPDSQRSILSVASRIGSKVGLKSNETEARILDSQTPMKNIKI